MVAGLHITILGSFRILIDSQPVPKLLSRKVELLLLYLALKAYPHPREIRSDLLWDDQPPHRAMTYLRTAFANLQKSCAPYLQITRQTLGINPDSPFSADVSDCIIQWMLPNTG
jgi:DNA-binding SARP family transcriptional activator